MIIDETIGEIESSNDWKFDNHEGYYYASYKTGQYNESNFVRTYDVTISYDSNSDKFEIFSTNNGKIISEFYGEDVKNFACNKKTALFIGKGWEWYFN